MYDLQKLYPCKEFMLETKICNNCNTRYRTIDSIGKLQCRYHPGSAYNDAFFDDSLRYSCCGQPLDKRDKRWRRELRYGCTPADHTILARPYEACDSLTTTEFPDASLLNSNSIVTYNQKESKYQLWRYDKTQADYRVRFHTYNKEIDVLLKGRRRTVDADIDYDSDYDPEFSCSSDDDVIDFFTEDYSSGTDDEEEVVPLIPRENEPLGNSFTL